MTHKTEECSECLGEKSYWTEWSDSAENSPYLKSLVLHYPDSPDGTVVIKCSQGCYDES